MSSESGQTMGRRDRPACRDTSDKMVAGVCSGVSDVRLYGRETRPSRIGFNDLRGRNG